MLNESTGIRQPSTAYLDIIAEESRAFRARRAYEYSSHFSGAEQNLREKLNSIIEEQTEIRQKILRQIHAHPETAFEEYRAAELLAKEIQSQGISVQRGVFGLDTALCAETTVGEYNPKKDPSIAILAEYDALPGIGHGCGHNVIATMGFGAFIALSRLLTEEKPGFSGRLVFLGTPAEEGHTGKEYMAQQGAFDGIDAAVMAHPYTSDLADQVWLGRRTLTVQFRGKTAHASAQPFMGVNALDAASLAYQGLGVLRQHMPPSDRLHAIITEGGHRASVIPETSTMNLYVRSKYPQTLQDLSEKVENVMKGAALMTGTQVEINWDEHPASLPMRTNKVLTDRWVMAQRERGRDPLPFGSVSETLAASTDFGNVSYLIPGAHPVIQIASEDYALHTRDFTDAAISPAAFSAATDGAYGLAATALDFLADPLLVAAAKEEFRAAGGPQTIADFFGK